MNSNLTGLVQELIKILFVEQLLFDQIMASGSVAEISNLRDFEDVLGHIGGWGRYQKILLLFFIIFCAFDAYIMYVPVLFLYIPDHWCSPHPSFSNSSLELEEIIELTIPLDQNGQRSMCEMYDISFNNVSVHVIINFRYENEHITMIK